MGYKTLLLSLQNYELCVFTSLSNVLSSEGRYISKIEHLSLKEFVLIRRMFCEKHHLTKTCQECSKLISAAQTILEKGITLLKDVFVKHFLKDSSKYKTDKAIRRLVQLPVAIIPIYSKTKKSTTLYVTEKNSNINYQVFEQFTQSYVEVENQGHVKTELSKKTLAMICKLASSEKDRCLIKYTACAATPNISFRMCSKALQDF